MRLTRVCAFSTSTKSRAVRMVTRTAWWTDTGRPCPTGFDCTRLPVHYCRSTFRARRSPRARRTAQRKLLSQHMRSWGHIPDTRRRSNPATANIDPNFGTGYRCRRSGGVTLVCCGAGRGRIWRRRHSKRCTRGLMRRRGWESNDPLS